MSDETLYQRLGGADGVDRLVEAFYGYMDALPDAAEVRAMHEADLEPLKRDLKHYFSEWTGGPALYSPEKGHPRLKMRHMPFAIGQAERDAWMLCMDKALADTIADPAARTELGGNIAKLADWMRNKAEAGVYRAPNPG